MQFDGVWTHGRQRINRSNKKGRWIDDPAAFSMLQGTDSDLVHSAAHAAVTSRRSSRCFLLLGDLSDQSLGRQHETGNR